MSKAWTPKTQILHFTFSPTQNYTVHKPRAGNTSSRTRVFGSLSCQTLATLKCSLGSSVGIFRTSLRGLNPVQTSRSRSVGSAQTRCVNARTGCTKKDARSEHRRWFFLHDKPPPQILSGWRVDVGREGV